MVDLQEVTSSLEIDGNCKIHFSHPPSLRLYNDKQIFVNMNLLRHQIYLDFYV